MGLNKTSRGSFHTIEKKKKTDDSRRAGLSQQRIDLWHIQDAPNSGIGSVSVQQGIQIAFFSKALAAAEQNYSRAEKNA